MLAGVCVSGGSSGGLGVQQRRELVNHILQPAAETPGHPSDSSAFGRVQYTQHEQTYSQLSALVVTLVVESWMFPIILYN